MILQGAIVIFGIGALLVILSALSRGSLKIENVCDLSRKDRPVQFYATLGFAALIIGLVAGACGYGMIAEIGGVMQWSGETRT